MGSKVTKTKSKYGNTSVSNKTERLQRSGKLTLISHWKIKY